MAERTIIKIGDSILRTVCRPISKITPKVLKLLDDMADTLYAGKGRAGLAAPQVGIAKRLVVIDCGDGLIELINPEIIEMSGEQVGPEACLSMPGLVGHKVKRAKKVVVRTQTRSGEETVIQAKGTLARCLQHEIDHLNGILFIDHVQPGHLFCELTDETVNLFEVITYSKPKL